MSEQEHLGERIRRRRVDLGLSLARLSEMVGCAKSYLSQIENGLRSGVREDLLGAIEEALMLPSGELVELSRLERTPASVRERLEAAEARGRQVRELLRLLGEGGLDEAYRQGRLRELIGAIGEDEPRPVRLEHEVPLINSVAAGYPTEFTDLGYPARVADEYVRCPDLSDPDAFAARVVGDSMEPEYREGDIVIFSPARDITDGKDCFCRLEPDHETTFKRVFFERGEQGQELIRLQPLNMAYPPRVLPREQVAGLYAAVSVMRMVP